MKRGLALVMATALASASAAAVAQPTAEPPRAAPGLHEATEVPAPNEPAVAPSEPDRRPLYVAGGVLVLAGLFFWNRRRRSELERRAEDETRRGRGAARAARAARAPGGDDREDPDAADLRAAAARDPGEEDPT